MTTPSTSDMADTAAMVSLGAKPLAQPAPVWVVGTYLDDGQPNLMCAAWGGICCSEPPCVQISLRKATATYKQLKKRKAFTLAPADPPRMECSDYVGMVSGATVNKFEAAGLTAVRSELVDAPYAAQYSMVLECEVIHTLELGLHTLFVGEIKDVKAKKAVLDAQGKHADMAKVNPLLFAPGSRLYYTLGEVAGQAFAAGKACMKKA